MAFRPEILLDGIFGIATGILYLYVAHIIHSRNQDAESARLANTLFAVWWLGLGLESLVVGAYATSTAFAVRDLALAITTINLAVLLVSVALWGLIYYLVYLYTGNPRWLAPITVAYALIAVALLYLVAWLHPIGTLDTARTVQIVYENRLLGWRLVTFSILVSGPVLMAAILYGSLYFRVRQPIQRYRIALVSGAFTVWFTWSLIANALGLAQRYPDSLGLLLTNRFLGLAVPLLILLAYKPPNAVTRRIGAEPRTREAA